MRRKIPDAVVVAMLFPASCKIAAGVVVYVLRQQEVRMHNALCAAQKRGFRW